MLAGPGYVALLGPYITILILLYFHDSSFVTAWALVQDNAVVEVGLSNLAAATGARLFGLKQALWDSNGLVVCSNS